MTRPWTVYFNMELLRQNEMAYKATFFRGEIMNTNPVLSYNGIELEPYHAERTERGWRLFYPPGTDMPATPSLWPNQLATRGWRMVRCGKEPDGSLLVIVERMQP